MINNSQYNDCLMTYDLTVRYPGIFQFVYGRRVGPIHKDASKGTYMSSYRKPAQPSKWEMEKKMNSGELQDQVMFNIGGITHV